MSSLYRLLLLPVLPLVFIACGGSVERVPDPNGTGGGSNAADGSSSSSGGGGAGGSGGDRVCTMAPACNQGDRSFASSDAACIEINGVSCYERSACGSTIWCQHTEDQCAAVPSCKPGWFEVKGCVPDSNCEKVTVCGKTIICQEMCEGPQPLCDNGDTQVGGPNDCPQDASCYSRSNGCGYEIWCTGP